MEMLLPWGRAECIDDNIQSFDIGASGKAGSMILKEASERGHEVTAIVRSASKMANSDAAVIEKDIFNLTAADIKGSCPGAAPNALTTTSSPLMSAAVRLKMSFSMTAASLFAIFDALLTIAVTSFHHQHVTNLVTNNQIIGGSDYENRYYRCKR